MIDQLLLIKKLINESNIGVYETIQLVNIIC